VSPLRDAFGLDENRNMARPTPPPRVTDEGLFTSDLFRFLADLRTHNDRAWFAKNKERYLDSVQDPALEFVRSFGPYLSRISPNFVGDDRPVGGSVFRIYRDVRFSKDKSPYKTWIGVDFRHRAGRDVHGPSFYLHLQPGQTFMAAGVWHPEKATLDRIRQAIIERAGRWKRIVEDEAFIARFHRSGDSLKRAPAGVDPDHPLIEDLKRKDHVCDAMLDEGTVTSEDFLPVFADHCRAAAPYVKFLCEAVGLPF
jgi:uncharacterized protein (TIGR02453 family)